MNKILIEVSAGELFDKISILEIKKVKIKDHAKLIDIERELQTDEFEVDLLDPLLKDLFL